MHTIILFFENNDNYMFIKITFNHFFKKKVLILLFVKKIIKDKNM